MRTLVERNGWRTWSERRATLGSKTLTAARPRERDLETSDKTDRQFRQPGRHHSLRFITDGSRTQAEDSDALRARWLEEHDIRTEFLDAGIGCCWFAQQGDREPVSGETEDEAIARLARENGLPWHEV